MNASIKLYPPLIAVREFIVHDKGMRFQASA